MLPMVLALAMTAAPTPAEAKLVGEWNFTYRLDAPLEGQAVDLVLKKDKTFTFAGLDGEAPTDGGVMKGKWALIAGEVPVVKLTLADGTAPFEFNFTYPLLSQRAGGGVVALVKRFTARPADLVGTWLPTEDGGMSIALERDGGVSFPGEPQAPPFAWASGEGHLQWIVPGDFMFFRYALSAKKDQLTLTPLVTGTGSPPPVPAMTLKREAKKSK